MTSKQPRQSLNRSIGLWREHAGSFPSTVRDCGGSPRGLPAARTTGSAAKKATCTCLDTAAPPTSPSPVHPHASAAGARHELRRVRRFDVVLVSTSFIGQSLLSLRELRHWCVLILTCDSHRAWSVDVVGDHRLRHLRSVHRGASPARSIRIAVRRSHVLGRCVRARVLAYHHGEQAASRIGTDNGKCQQRGGNSRDNTRYSLPSGCGGLHACWVPG